MQAKRIPEAQSSVGSALRRDTTSEVVSILADTLLDRLIPGGGRLTGVSGMPLILRGKTALVSSGGGAGPRQQREGEGDEE
jgi:hypothetical protein